MTVTPGRPLHNLRRMAIAVPLAFLSIAQSARASEDEPIRTLLEPDAIPSVENPGLLTAADATFMHDDELVIGVVGSDGIARAYATVVLDHHEIVNDVAGAVPIAVAW